MTSEIKSYILCHTKVLCVCVLCVYLNKTYVTMPYFVLFYFISFDLISFPFRGILGKGLGTDETASRSCPQFEGWALLRLKNVRSRLSGSEHARAWRNECI